MIFGGRSKDDDTVVALLASAIRRDISFGVLAPDHKLKINVLRQSYGGSSHSMRETLRMLEAEGLVDATSQRGFRVTSATLDDLRDVLLMRLEIERIGLSRAMVRGDIKWESRVVAAFHALARADAAVQNFPDDATALEWDEANRGASEAILSACGSPRLITIAEMFFNQSRRFRLALLREGRIDFATRATRQVQLNKAILARDQVVALALLEQDLKADLGV